MITLHGFAFSNYYNIVKHVLTHKGIAFVEEVNFGGTEAYLNISPSSKIPSITTGDGGNLSEPSACCDDPEKVYPVPPFHPRDSEADSPAFFDLLKQRPGT